MDSETNNHKSGQRYLCSGYDGYMQEFSLGDYVHYADYAFLKAEVERLKNNCEYLDKKLDEEIEKNERLNELILRGASVPDARPIE